MNSPISLGSGRWRGARLAWPAKNKVSSDLYPFWWKRRVAKLGLKSRFAAVNISPIVDTANILKSVEDERVEKNRIGRIVSCRLDLIHLPLSSSQFRPFGNIYPATHL